MIRSLIFIFICLIYYAIYYEKLKVAKANDDMVKCMQLAVGCEISRFLIIVTAMMEGIFQIFFGVL